MIDTRFYILKYKLFDDSKYAYGEQREVNYNTGQAKLCEGCGRAISMLECLPPYEIKVSKKNLGDFIFGTYVGFIVSKKFKEKYEQSNLKGLNNFNEVTLFYKSKPLSEKYFYPTFPLICEFINLKQVQFEEEHLCDVCQKGGSIIRRINGISFLHPTRINVDIFFTTALGQSTVIVTEDFKHFIEVNTFSNMQFVEASRYKWDSLNPFIEI